MTDESFVSEKEIDSLHGIETVKNNDDPFHKDNVGGVQLIVLMRIYDVLLGIYREENPEYAESLAHLHAEGKLLGSLPWLNIEDDEE